MRAGKWQRVGRITDKLYLRLSFFAVVHPKNIETGGQSVGSHCWFLPSPFLLFFRSIVTFFRMFSSVQILSTTGGGFLTPVV
jgi:hypothetical protein